MKAVPAQANRTAPKPPHTGTDRRSDYDLLVIGTGAAGMAAAIRASELGVSVGIVEAGQVGGTCVNVGCIPSKNLVEAADHYYAGAHSFPGVRAGIGQIDWPELQRQKAELVDTLRQEKYLDVIAAYPEISLITGRATLLGDGKVQIADREVQAAKIVIATGTRPSLPSIPGLENSGALDSTSVMELKALPASMIVIGGGSIGLELGQTFARFGVKVIVLEAADRILPAEDADLGEALLDALTAEGIEVHSGVTLTEVVRSQDRFTVHMRTGSVVGSVSAEQLLVSTGRRPNTEGLGLAAAGVAVDGRGFLTVDHFMRTSNPDIYAAGDVTGGPGYVYVAALGGGIAAQAALSGFSGQEPLPIDLTATPRVTFTDPQVAAVGMTEADARAAGYRPKTSTLPMGYLPRALVSHQPRGLIKLIADSESDRLLGAHMVSTNAGDIIGEAVLAVRFGLRVQDIVSTMHPYLTWAESIKLAGQSFTTEVAKLSCCA